MKGSPVRVRASAFISRAPLCRWRGAPTRRLPLLALEPPPCRSSGSSAAGGLALRAGRAVSGHLREELEDAPGDLVEAPLCLVSPCGLRSCELRHLESFRDIGRLGGLDAYRPRSAWIMTAAAPARASGPPIPPRRTGALQPRWWPRSRHREPLGEGSRPGPRQTPCPRRAPAPGRPPCGATRGRTLPRGPLRLPRRTSPRRSAVARDAGGWESRHPRSSPVLLPV